MTEQEFRDQLAADGITNVVMVEREANGGMDTHSHPFEARLLILEGDITIVVDGVTRHCGPGETFRLGADVPHIEKYGPQGVRYLAGRK